jgi:hypothetical protein
MKKESCLQLICAVFCFALTPITFAQTSPGGMLFNPTVDLSAGAQNGFVGTVGGVFHTTYSYWPDVNWLGYYDKDGDGLVNSHVVSLWDGATVVAQVTIPAGTSAPLVNGYRWAPLASTVGLWYGHWYVIGAQVDGVDTWGDLITKGNNQVAWNPQYLEVSSGWEFSRAGRYDGPETWPNPPANQTSAQDSIYPVANMGYNIAVVPEPGNVALFGVGLVVCWAAVRRRGATDNSR